MNKEKINKIHYIYSTSLNKSHMGVLERPKNIENRELGDPLNKAQINNKNGYLIEIKDNLPTNKEKIKTNITNYKNCSSNINNNIINNFNKINSQENNLNRLIRASNSFINKKELKCCCCCCCCCISFLYTPKKYRKIMKQNIKTQLKENTIGHKRCMSIDGKKKRRSNITIINPIENKVSKKDIEKENNIKLKNYKALTELPSKNKDSKNQKNEIKFPTNKIFDKKVKKRKKYDLMTINDIGSKEERLRNLIYGISYLKDKKECELCHEMVYRHTYTFHYYSHPAPILNWLFIGNLKNANNKEEIKIIGIKNILNCAAEIQKLDIADDVNYCHIKLTDSSDIDITQFFDQAFSFIESARKRKEKILIHCKLGISRSPAIVIGYLIKYMGYSTESALSFLREKRTQVYPNKGFISQLNMYEQKINPKKNNSLIKS